MELIPVIDLMGGAVVHARRGARAAYRPIETPLSASAAPQDVAEGLLALGTFRTLYIADLDAIAGAAGHDAVLEALAARHPGLALWVDAGEASPAALSRRVAGGPGRPVIGSESLADLAEAEAALASGAGLLSLDYGPEGPRGPGELHARADLWPEAVIVMTLARVGAGQGPDMERLSDILARAQGRRVYAAGGVRDVGDLHHLAELGIAGVLLASALHDGRLSREDIAAFMA
ncbi:phosphoribosylformimino-5-aminoimidazole carboxamide ribotide isomerase [Ancylobacter vacuolatus]|uniref:Phosphoribosylformimino-5-aminoimidazole carboxamide ribotide isomerase n=1 Tax=Ancylobacter vacuolatus TaxID=223389 RepID=A0ABU0DFF8_9HYPH|nr:HisA/HisF-related TIM barrel protein [Ancylobacter vacuolatus]MDQ0347160.1 phosphoribosylformimino-5-aminoimidazole carboxamide ribotide isomerase [Ancylobacter vacuolatus]